MKKIQNESIGYFNILKFLGCLVVAIFLHYNDHLAPYLGITNPLLTHHLLSYLSRYGYVCVELFFIISGILFVFFYFKKIIKGLSFEKFLKKRYLRIFPSVIITTFMMYILNYILYSKTFSFFRCGTLGLWDLLSDILFGGKAIFGIGNTLNGPIWYINVLFVVYIIAYFMVRIYKKYKHIYIYIYFAIPIIIGLAIHYSGLNVFFLNNCIARGLISFFTGILLGFYLQKFNNYEKTKVKKIKFILFLELLLFVYLTTKSTRDLYFKDITICYNFLFFPELIVLLFNFEPLNKLCSSRFVTFLGNISFEVYLWNFPIMITFYILSVTNIINMSFNTLGFFIIFILTHLIVSIIGYYLIDVLLVNHLKKKPFFK